MVGTALLRNTLAIKLRIIVIPIRIASITIRQEVDKPRSVCVLSLVVVEAVAAEEPPMHADLTRRASETPSFHTLAPLRLHSLQTSKHPNYHA